MNINYDIYEFQDKAKQVQKDNYKTKQEKFEVQQQIQIIKNRLLMLKNEENKQEGQIKNHQQKIQKIIKVNQDKKLIKELKLKIQENNRQYCLERLNKAQTLKNSILSRVNSQRQNILEVKKKEYIQQRSLSKQYDQEIKQKKLEYLQDKEENCKLQKEKLMNKREKILTYWENKYQGFIDDKILSQKQNEDQKKLKNQQLQKLLNQESQQIQNLQQSLELKRKLQGLDFYQQILE